MSGLLKFNPGTIEDVRKEYNLEKPGMMDQAIKILHEWIQKQDHFVKKDFCREYLERVIISTKGSVERAKVRVDKICTLRTMVPELFDKCNVKQDLSNLKDVYLNVYMPKLTEDNYRLYMAQIKHGVTASIVKDAYKHNMILGEYLKRHDYANGIIIVLDVSNCNIIEFVKELNIMDMNNVIIMYTEGFGFRIRNIFIISTSKVIDLFTSILRRLLSPKIGERIMVIKHGDDLKDHVHKELLPKDYGGTQKSLSDLYDQWTEELSSEENVTYLKEMTRASTNESLRQSEQSNDEYLGIAGSFKNITVD